MKIIVHLFVSMELKQFIVYLCVSMACSSNLGFGLAVSKPIFVDVYCRGIYYNTTNIPFGANLNFLLSSLSSNASSSSNNGFYYTTTGQNQDQVYGSFLCRGDVTHNTCQNCVEITVKEIKQRCPVDQEAILWYEECILRYSYLSIFSVLTEFPRFFVLESRTVSDPNGFNQTLSNLMDSLATRAAYSGSSSRILHFATGEANFTRFRKIYGLLQCSPDLSPSDCYLCLRAGIDQISSDANGSSGWGVYCPSCVVRYGDSPFYQLNSTASAPRISLVPPLSHLLHQQKIEPQSNQLSIWRKPYPFSSSLSTPLHPTTMDSQQHLSSGQNQDQIFSFAEVMLHPRPARISSKLQLKRSNDASQSTKKPIFGKRSNSHHIGVIVTVPMVLIVTFLLITCFFYVQRKAQKQKVNLMDEIKTTESLQFGFSTIKAATNDFSDGNKVGVGGFGVVYKGTLSDGQEIAVKRLSRNSTQGEVEFKNEVVLLAKLQHRNLVRLLGFCLEGEEKQLIYEFVPYGSLDYFLFDPMKRADLDWDRLYRIIEGIARGLLYLHVDSQFKIIHRDLKPSNILLDVDMNPKISDFGMASLVLMDQTQHNTNKIVGTHGYMPPEYAVKGLFSVKSDVYSFGVILLEIVSGKRISSFHLTENSQTLLEYGWRLWHDGKGLEFIDPLLKDSGPTSS